MMIQSKLTKAKTAGIGLGRPPRPKEQLAMQDTQETSISLPDGGEQTYEHLTDTPAGAKSMTPAMWGWA
jgi:hypothetical protein